MFTLTQDSFLMTTFDLTVLLVVVLVVLFVVVLVYELLFEEDPFDKIFP